VTSKVRKRILPMVRCEGRENLFLISASLLPRTGVSTVTARALYPAFSALRTRSNVTLRSCSGVVEKVRIREWRRTVWIPGHAVRVVKIFLQLLWWYLPCTHTAGTNDIPQVRHWRPPQEVSWTKRIKS
jgi:hypothetical protein